MQNTQINKLEQNWKLNAPRFGQETWEQEPDFCYYIQSPLPLETAQQLVAFSQRFKTDNALQEGHWLEPDQLSLTITLPGRLGTHFQKNDLPFMKQTLKAITAKTPAFEIRVQNLNVFPHSVWMEVHDESGRLQQLHETLCQEIPFSQHPEFRYQNYLPHISLGYGINAKNPLKAETPRETEPVIYTLDTLELGRAKWQGSELKKVASATFQLTDK